VDNLAWDLLEQFTAIEEIAFARGSRLSELELCVFTACPSLKSICIPACIEIIRFSWSGDDTDYDFPPSPVERITFEPGSRLRKIEKMSFYKFDSLRSICLPASVESVDGSTFLDSSLRHISVESGNRFFRASGPFLLDFEGSQIVRYFGDGPDVVIASEIETLGHCCFSCCHISSVRIDSPSRLSVIEVEAFRFCGLQSMNIPFSVTILCESCFADCDSLEAVVFDAESQQVSIDADVFSGCVTLKSIVLPSTLEIIGNSCFFRCHKLESVVFAEDSRLVRIEGMAFSRCESLKSLSLPPLLEFVGPHCFTGCSCFSTLTFASPSRLRVLLDAPVLWAGFQAIPDSVEVLQLCRSGHDRDWCTLTFGDESRLREVGTNLFPIGTVFPSSVGQFRFFLRATSRSVKLFRLNLEFGKSG
jgi:hypothetical protein